MNWESETHMFSTSVRLLNASGNSPTNEKVSLFPYLVVPEIPVNLYTKPDNIEGQITMSY